MLKWQVDYEGFFLMGFTLLGVLVWTFALYGIWRLVGA